MSENMPSCKHEFHFHVATYCFDDRPPFAQVEITGHCTKCAAAVEFIGMECGVNMNGPAVSPDHREARLAAIITREPASLKCHGGTIRMKTSRQPFETLKHARNWRLARGR